jgi:transglutaminase/protease-like cytokinesis protein 3
MLGVLLKLIISGIFDPTWGSGFVNNGKFVNAFDDRYFKANPSEIIASHAV